MVHFAGAADFGVCRAIDSSGFQFLAVAVLYVAFPKRVPGLGLETLE